MSFHYPDVEEKKKLRIDKLEKKNEGGLLSSFTMGRLIIV